MTDQLVIEVVPGDALEIDCDILALKYAQALYGVDLAVAEKLSIDIAILPKPSGFRLVKSEGRLGAKQILFVGVPPLRQFGYRDIREFARKVLVSLTGQSPQVQRICLTLHGAGYGLDEVESFESEIAGLVDAIASGDLPDQLSEIIVVERNPARAKRLQQVLGRLIPQGSILSNGKETSHSLGEGQSELLRAAGYASASKPYIFVAMPFSAEMDDTFHYGIQGAVNSAGFLCERADTSSFTGDVMDWVKKRVSNAVLVVADLSTANPNVYLEVGYAWGCGKQTILLVRDASDLKFDVKGQRCLVYKKIKDLEESLGKELMKLFRSKPSSANGT